MSKIALVHDYFIQMGGAERVALAMHDSFPSAPIYTTVALQHRLPHQLRGAVVAGDFTTEGHRAPLCPSVVK